MENNEISEEIIKNENNLEENKE